MLQGVLDLFKTYFGFVYDFYSKTFMVSENISAWDLLIVFFVAGGIITLIIRTFGASGIASSGSSVIKAERNRNVKQSSNSKKGG